MAFGKKLKKALKALGDVDKRRQVTCLVGNCGGFVANRARGAVDMTSIMAV